jgi:hypothetical protein
MSKTRRLRPSSGELTIEELLSLRLRDSDKALLAFGKAMAAWARIEIGFYGWFEHIGDFDLRQAKPIYYSATNFKSRMDLIRAAMDGVTLEIDEEKFIKAAMAVAIKYNSFRNKLAHGEFTFDGLLVEGKHVDRRKARAEAITAEELQAFAGSANEFSAILFTARNIALGEFQDGEVRTTLAKCTEDLTALPNAFKKGNSLPGN